jgi:multisubunit Na+/H+ antiporter MnhG subunit
MLIFYRNRKREKNLNYLFGTMFFLIKIVIFWNEKKNIKLNVLTYIFFFNINAPVLAMDNEDIGDIAN